MSSCRPCNARSTNMSASAACPLSAWIWANCDRAGECSGFSFRMRCKSGSASSRRPSVMRDSHHCQRIRNSSAGSLMVARFRAFLAEDRSSKSRNIRAVSKWMGALSGSCWAARSRSGLAWIACCCRRRREPAASSKRALSSPRWMACR